MARPYSNYQDPYQEGGQEYLNDNQTPGGSSTLTANNGGEYGHYNNYARSSMEKVHDPDGVNALGEIGGGQRQQPGRAHLGAAGPPISHFEAFGPPPRSTGVLRMWRKDERGKQWTRGGGCRSGTRMVCCCLTVTILLVISIILSILLYIRPPSVIINTSDWQSQAAGIKIDNGRLSGVIPVAVSVTNPNWFDADFKTIKAVVKPDGSNLVLGQGITNNAKFGRYQRSDFTFDVNMNFTFTDSGNDVKTVLNLLKKTCVTPTSNLPIKIGIGLWLRLIGQTIKIPDITISPSITCPEGIDQLTQGA